MTSKLTRERLAKIKSWRETYGAGSNVMLPAEEAEELARIALAAMDSEPVGSISIDRLLQLLYQFDGANECAASIGDQEYALECGDVASALRELLSCRSALPVADVVAWSNPNEERKCDIRWRRHDVEPGPLYRHAQPAPVVPGWIPVSERMPDVGVKVLCFPAKDEPIHATFNGQLWLQDVSWSGSEEPIDNVIPVTVTHWMPLPAAPQEVKSES
ncbi:TPA: DUF551 domain-containing protein [Klebsiella quasipneumoniae subsp. quasipneumoniae]